MSDFDYVSECNVTASNTFDPKNVGVNELIDVLEKVIYYAQQMDRFKKALFRKRTRAESNLTGNYKTVWDSLEKEIDDINKYDDLFHGIIGSITEVGELAEILYALLNCKEKPNITNVREEIGDNLWYLSRLVKFAETTFEDEMKRNIKKLRARHTATGFDKARDINRNLEAERKLLEE